MGKDVNRDQSTAKAAPPKQSPAARYRFIKEADIKRETQHWEYVERLQDGILHDAICAVTAAGDAIQFSRSRDGGAFGIRVYDGSNSPTKWCNTPGEALTVLLSIIEDARLASGGL